MKIRTIPACQISSDAPENWWNCLRPCWDVIRLLFHENMTHAAITERKKQVKYVLCSILVEILSTVWQDSFALLKSSCVTSDNCVLPVSTCQCPLWCGRTRLTCTDLNFIQHLWNEPGSFVVYAWKLNEICDWLHFPLPGFILESLDYLDLVSVEKKENLAWV